jgi:hypothetical protein
LREVVCVKIIKVEFVNVKSDNEDVMLQSTDLDFCLGENGERLLRKYPDVLVVPASGMLGACILSRKVYLDAVKYHLPTGPKGCMRFTNETTYVENLHTFIDRCQKDILSRDFFAGYKAPQWLNTIESLALPTKHIFWKDGDGADMEYDYDLGDGFGPTHVYSLLFLCTLLRSRNLRELTFAATDYVTEMKRKGVRNAGLRCTESVRRGMRLLREEMKRRAGLGEAWSIPKILAVG